MIEQTLVLLKPDAVARGLVGEIINRFERVGLKIIAAKMLQASEELINRHYPTARREWLVEMGEKALANNVKMGIDSRQAFGSTEPYEVGLKIQSFSIGYLQQGPVWALILSGPSAISVVRKLRGATLPSEAAPGTINGDFSFDSAAFANPQQRSIYNLVHASGNAEEAALEISIWFAPEEIHDYQTVHQRLMVGGEDKLS